jgi:hypothetical protein
MADREGVDMAEATCSIEGCARPRDKRGWCVTHYRRWRKDGDPGGPIRRWERGRICSIGDCGRPHFISDLCRTHYWRRSKHGDARPSEPIKAWGADDIAYPAAHARVKSLRGLASTHQCNHCSEQAAHWAYDHGDPDEKIEPAYQGKFDVPFSLDPAHYMPLCASCHRRFDVAAARRRRATAGTP